MPSLPDIKISLLMVSQSNFKNKNLMEITQSLKLSVILPLKTEPVKTPLLLKCQTPLMKTGVISLSLNLSLNLLSYLLKCKPLMEETLLTSE